MVSGAPGASSKCGCAKVNYLDKVKIVHRYYHQPMEDLVSYKSGISNDVIVRD